MPKVVVVTAVRQAAAALVLFTAACSSGAGQEASQRPSASGSASTASGPATTEPAGSTTGGASATTFPNVPTTAPPARPSAADPVKAQAMLDTWRDQVDAFGTNLGVRVPGEPDLLLASGVDDRTPDTPMRTDGAFFIASVTKTFVGALVLQLADEGRLSLDDPVERWLPGVVPRGGEITLRMLLSHTSGLADFDNDAPEAFRTIVLSDLTRRFSAAEAVSYSVSLPAVGEPGKQYHYANAGYQLLGEVVEAAAGAPLPELIQSRLTAPLGLTSTVFDDGALLPGELHSWFTLDDAIGDADRGTFDPSVPRDLDLYDFPRTALISYSGAAGAMRSTLSDLLSWGDGLYGGRVVSEASTALLTNVTDGTPRRADRYGLGVIGFAPDGSNGTPAFVGHDGATVGNRTLLARTPAGVVVVIHTNVGEVALADLVALASGVVDLTVG